MLFPLVLAAGCCLLLAGCSGKPADVPDVFPCTVIVKNGETPIEKCEVLLGATNITGAAWTASGVTDAGGIAVIYTRRINWQGSGAPKGEYTVSVSKAPEAPAGLPPEEFAKLDPDAQEKYLAKQQREYEKLPREIPMELADFAQSPFRLTVTKGGENKVEIDISTFKPKNKVQK